MIKGIVLAGGVGSRLYPLTACMSKQLLPVYDKPMIYYPISVLMLAGIRKILIISTPEDLPRFEKLMGSGRQWGIELSYAIQEKPEGIAQAFLIAEPFIGKDRSVLILGDNIFYGNAFPSIIKEAFKQKKPATIFAYKVNSPERYGVVTFDAKGDALSIDEKPKKPKSRYAVTGLYIYDHSVVEIAKQLVPSKRKELEITDINKHYLSKGELAVKILGRGNAWMDAGTFESLTEASFFIQMLQNRQGVKIACLEEIAYREKYISAEELLNSPAMHDYPDSSYSTYLKDILTDFVP